MGHEPKAWYGTRTFYRWLTWENRPFEERVVLFRARSLEEAVERAEQESAEYAREGDREVLEASGSPARTLAPFFVRLAHRAAPTGGKALGALLEVVGIDSPPLP